MNLLKYLPEWMKSKNKPTQEQIEKREEELALAIARMNLAKSKDYPLIKEWLCSKMIGYMNELQVKKDLSPLHKAEAIDEILNEIESAEKFVLAETENLNELKNKKIESAGY